LKIYCVVIDRNLAASKCPLPDVNDCMWCNKQTGACKYTAKDVSVNEFCELVGVKIPTKERLNGLREELASFTKRHLDGD